MKGLVLKLYVLLKYFMDIWIYGYVAVSTNLYFDGTFLYYFCLAWFLKNASLQQTTVSYCQQSFIVNLQPFDNPASPEAASGSPSSDVLRGVASH